VPEAPAIRPGRIDVEDEASIAAAAEAVAAAGGPPRLVIVATGFLHDAGQRPEKSWRDLDPEALARAFRVNATGPALVAKHFLPLVPRKERAVFAALSARVGSVADNRIGGWHGYRASKAALNQILRCLAIEAGRTRPEWVVTGLQPGTVATPLSAPFRSGLDADDLFAPDDAAARLLGVLAALGPEQSGRLFDWSGAEFPP
jgi:NAD(P)-dependent dehydrogenase (short-subunit alcohol dehydrogenase family)